MFSLAVYWSPPRHRTISQIGSSIRKISKNKTMKAEYQHQPHSTLHGHIKLDTHADTAVLGSNCVVLSYTGKECEVSPYSSQYKAVQTVPVITGAMVWTNATDGTAYLLIFHESLWMGNKLDHTLVNPNQLRAYSVSMQDNPFDAKPLSITTNDASVELYSEGMIICGDTRTPTESKLGRLPWLILTSLHDWDHHTVCFVEFWGLPPLILFFNMSTGWFGRFFLSTIVNQNKEAWLQESKLAKMLCTGCREFGTNSCKFLSKVKHLIF